jgi:hypothetical protein
MKKIKLIIILFLVVTLGLVLMILLNPINHKGKIKVSIIIAPKDANIIIDGKRAKSGTNYLLPGKYKVTASRQHFTSIKITIDVSQTSSVFPIELAANDSTGQILVKEQYADFIDVEGYASREHDQQVSAAVQSYPIINNLPIDATPNYRIDYGISKKYPDNSSKVALYVSANSSFYRQTALYVIYSLGYDPSDYEIIFQPLDLSNL